MTVSVGHAKLRSSNQAMTSASKTLFETNKFFNKLIAFCPSRLVARTLPFQGGEDGSKPFWGTILKRITFDSCILSEKEEFLVFFNMVSLMPCSTSGEVSWLSTNSDEFDSRTGYQFQWGRSVNGLAQRTFNPPGVGFESHRPYQYFNAVEFTWW